MGFHTVSDAYSKKKHAIEKNRKSLSAIFRKPAFPRGCCGVSMGSDLSGGTVGNPYFGMEWARWREVPPSTVGMGEDGVTQITLCGQTL